MEPHDTQPGQPEQSDPTEPTVSAADLWPELTPEEAVSLSPGVLALANRRRLAAELYLRHLSVRDIAAELKCSHQTVCNDLKAVLDGYKRMAARATADRLADALVRLNRLETELWAAFDRSKGARIETRSERGMGIRSGERAAVKKVERDGNPQWTAQILAVQRHRSVLTGLVGADDLKAAAAALPQVKLVAGLDPAEVV